MKSTGMIRHMDALGRIVIPMEIRRSLNIDTNDPLEIYVSAGTRSLKPSKMQCVCCESQNQTGLTEVNGVHLCKRCIDAFGANHT